MTCQLTFLPVGNADSIVIQTDNSTLVVDLGKPDVLEEWIEKHHILKINRIYITHAHGDHCPSPTRLVEFLSNWRDKIDIDHLHFPYDLIRAARSKIKAHRNDPNYDCTTLKSKKYRMLDNALVHIGQWAKNREITHSSFMRDGDKYSKGALKVEALHPNQYYVENNFDLNASKLNEISTVLRIGYGKFSALLLADIEGAGLTEFLSFLKMNAGSTECKASVIKMPHHGAYPTNGDDLKELLALINPEIAVLSVGSKNTYGHVEPELFKALIELQNNDPQLLKQFICTEVTRTCKYSASHRLTMGKKGLSVTEKCAGEITIVADISGKWELKTETVDHASRVDSFSHAACRGCADLG